MKRLLETKSLTTRDLLLLILGFASGILVYSVVSTVFFTPIITPIFSPDNSYEIISAINNAKESIDIEVYVFASEEILDALKKAHERGIKIRVIIEKRVISGNNAEIFNALNAAGIDVRWASNKFALTHSKFVIIDGKKVIVGSHNFSNHAFYLNREASLLIEKSVAVEEFKKIFEEDWKIAS